VIDLQLPSDVNAPGSARRALEDLSGRIDSSVLDDLRLLVSELVTNGVRHAGQGPSGWVHLVIRLNPDGIRVEVSDPGPGFGEVPPPTIYQESGWGLYLVEQVSNRWGVERKRGNTVWFEVDCQVRVA
jgi:anti-sigma regulatory factor (Ser/Thr protein kinase)